MARRLFVFLMVYLLVACAQVPEYERPIAPIPANWPSTVVRNEVSLAGHLHWRAFFKDPRLQAMIATALLNNRDMKIAAARVEEARAQYGIARADFFPSIGVVGSGSLVGTTGDLAGSASYSTARRYDFNVSAISYEVDFWGRISGMSEVARSAYLATQSSARTVQLSLISELASSYFALLQSEEFVALAQSNVKLREETLDVVGKGRDAGGTFDFEYQQASSAVESAKAALEGIQYQRAVAVNKLAYLVGSNLDDFPVGLALGNQDLDASVPAGLPAEILLQRPDVIAAEQRLMSTHANIGVARAAFLPKVLLTAGIGAASQGLSSLFAGGAWSFQPVLSAPLFDGGRLSSSLEVAQARKVIAVAEYEKTIQLAFREVADLLFAKGSMSRQVEAARANVKSQEKRHEIVWARYQAGLVSYMEVLEAKRDLVLTRQTALQVRRVQLETEAQLFKAFGAEQSVAG